MTDTRTSSELVERMWEPAGHFACGHPKTPENTVSTCDKSRPNKVRCHTCKKAAKRKAWANSNPEQKKKSYEATRRWRKKQIEAAETIEALTAQLTRQSEEAGKLVAALERIGAGTPDIHPPFRAMPASELRRIAHDALAECGEWSATDVDGLCDFCGDDFAMQAARTRKDQAMTGTDETLDRLATIESVLRAAGVKPGEVAERARAILAALSPPEAVGEAVEQPWQTFRRLATPVPFWHNEQGWRERAEQFAAALASMPDDTALLLEARVFVSTLAMYDGDAPTEDRFVSLPAVVARRAKGFLARIDAALADRGRG